MANLTINPDSPAARVVTLTEGETTIGRADDNDVRVEEGGVSGHHCKVILSQGILTIVDLNSTNGTNFNGARISQTVWQPGQTIHLGQLPIRLEGGPTVAAPIPAIPPVAPHSSVRLRVTSQSESSSPASPPIAPAAAPPVVSGRQFAFAPIDTKCKSHPKSPAQWHCEKCRKYYCDLCVSTHSSHGVAVHQCRSCGSNCLPVKQAHAAPTRERGFFGRLPGAFIFPFRGSGTLVLIVATIVFALLNLISGFFGIITLVLTMMAVGYLFLFMQNIIHGAAAGEEEMPSMPDFDGLFGAFFTLVGTVLISFVLPVGLVIAKFCDVEIPASFLVGSIFLSWLYFPMAFLAVAMIDSVAAANPLVVIPAILKVPGQYLVTTIILCGVFGMRLLGESLSSMAGDVSLSTRDMSVMFVAFGFRAIWSLISLYLLVVGMRILGILYVTQKEKLGWF